MTYFRDTTDLAYREYCANIVDLQNNHCFKSCQPFTGNVAISQKLIKM